MKSENHGDNPDAHIEELESRLCILALKWRSTANAEIRQEIKKEYHSIVRSLFSLGWDDYVDLDCELPDEDMPQEYFSRNPNTSLGTNDNRSGNN